MGRTASRLIAVAIVGILALAHGAAAAAAQPSVEDRYFLLAAMAAGLAQVEVGKLAVDKASDERIRDFARRVLDHHEQAGDRLAEIARDESIEPPQEVDPATQGWVDRLRRLEGPQFDAAYAAGQVPSLYAAIWVHRREARHGSNGPWRAAAEREAEAIDAYQEEARRLAEDFAADLPDGLHPEDGTFLDFAMNVDLTQVRLGKLALDKASDERVRAFARHMVDDHGQSYDKFVRTAKANGVAPLEEISPVSERTRAWLEGLSSPAFDREYITSQVIHHGVWFYRYEHEAIHGRDEAVRELGADGAQMGKMHHDAALAIVRASDAAAAPSPAAGPAHDQD